MVSSCTYNWRRSDWSSTISTNGRVRSFARRLAISSIRYFSGAIISRSPRETCLRRVADEHIRCGVVASRGMASDDRAGRNHAALGHDNNAPANVVPIAVGLVDLGFVHQTRPVADAGILVDDGAIEHDVPPDAHR